MLRVWVLVSLAACGRFAFDPLADASSGTGDDAPDPCPHAFCDNFDRSTPVEDGWDALVGADGVMSIVTDQSVSPPQSMLIEAPIVAAGSLYLRKTFPQSATHIRLTTELAYTTTNASIAEIDLIALRWVTPPSPCSNLSFNLVRDSTGPLVIQETYTACGGNTSTAIGLTPGFHHIVMDVWFGGPGVAHVHIDIDNAQVFDTFPARTLPPSDMELRLGAAFLRDLAAPWEIRYDGVIVDLD